MGMLDGWRVVDLTDHRGEVGPYLLADLGATVHRVSPAEPEDRPGELDASEAAYNANKIPIALSGDTAADRASVLDLVAKANLVFQSGPPGRLATLGIDRAAVEAANATAVVVTVTPFGIDGPRADQPATELTIGALGGSVRLQGTPDRAPVQMSVPQVWRHAGAEAAGAALIAERRMRTCGRAQFVDVSAQSAMTWTMLNAMEAMEVQGRDFERTGSELHLSMAMPIRHETADGYTICVPTGRLVRHCWSLLIEDGIVDPSWADVEWDTYDHRLISGEDVWPPLTDVIAAVGELCRRSPKQELMVRGLGVGATFAPINTLADLLAFDHLDARRFWTEAEIDHQPVRAPGAPWVRNGDRPAAVRVGSTPAPATSGPRSAPVGTPATNGAEPPLPLAGLKVADFSWIGVGPITAKALADHGATVVRVESEARLDGLRLQPPFKDGEAGVNRSNFHGTFNTSKLGLALDLKEPAGQQVARRLTDWADVVIESFTPGTIGRLGLSYPEVAATNPSVIMVSTSLLASGSPVSGLAGYGYHAAAIAGFQNLVGWPDLPPDGPWLAYTDTIGPRFIVPAVLAALDHRDRTGEGSHLEVAQLEVALQFLAPELLRMERHGVEAERIGNRSPAYAPQGLYPTRGDDQWLAVSVVDDDRWSRLVDVMGRPAWATAAALATASGRQAAHDEIDANLARWTADHDGARLEADLAAAGIAAGVVQGSGQMAHDPQYVHRGFYAHHEHSEVGVMPYAGHQYRIDGYDHGPRFAPPCLGEHTYEVLTELLGLDDDAVADVAATGALL
ncbi:MAG: CoA transferase [Actinomycetota bacterium]